MNSPMVADEFQDEYSAERVFGECVKFAKPNCSILSSSTISGQIWAFVSLSNFHTVGKIAARDL